MTVYRIRLEGLTEKHDLQWVAECPAVQVMSQGRTQRQAMTALNDAVALWFESCIARGTLKDALAECGFSYMGAGRATDTVENAVEAIEVRGEQRPVPVFRILPDSPTIIEGTIPAALFAAQFDESHRVVD